MPYGFFSSDDRQWFDSDDLQWFEDLLLYIAIFNALDKNYVFSANDKNYNFIAKDKNYIITID